MAKVDIGGVISESLLFGFKRFFTVLRVVWAPSLVVFGLVVLLAVAILMPAFQHLSAMQTAADGQVDPAHFVEWIGLYMGPILLLYLVMIFAILLWSAMVGVPLQRLVILGEEPRGIFHVRLDGAIWRYVLVQVFQFLVISGVTIALSIVLSILLVLATATPPGAISLGWIVGEITASFSSALRYAQEFAREALVEWQFMPAAAGEHQNSLSDDEQRRALQAMRGSLATVLLSFVAVIYLSIKLLLSPPATAAENRIVFWRSWSLTQGNFFAIFVAGFLYFACIIGLSIAFSLITSAVDMVLLSFAPIAEPQDALAELALHPAVLLYFAWSLLVNIGFQVYTIGVGFAFAAVIYRQIVVDDQKGA